MKSGTLRALAVTDATRSEVLPDVPTIGEFVPSFEATTWLGLGAPKNTPTDIVQKLNIEINAGLADPKMKARIANWALQCSRVRPATSTSTSPTRPKSGAR